MILLAESGSTKTDWRIIGKEIHAFESIGLNPYFVSSLEVKTELEPHLNEITKNEIEEVHFYGTGITDPSKGDIIASGILSALSPQVKIYTYSDVVAAAKSLFGTSEGLACILGTGSNTCFWNGEKISFQIPPLGFWLGDEASGGYLGKALILAYLHKEMPLEIRTKFEEQFGAKDRIEILKHAYQLEKPNKYFAQYAPFILANLDQEFCYTLTVNAFKAFIDKYLVKYPQLQETPIGAVGSIAHYFEKPLKETLKLYNLTLSKVIKKPIDALVDFHSIKR